MVMSSTECESFSLIFLDTLTNLYSICYGYNAQDHERISWVDNDHDTKMVAWKDLADAVLPRKSYPLAVTMSSDKPI